MLSKLPSPGEGCGRAHVTAAPRVEQRRSFSARAQFLKTILCYVVVLLLLLLVVLLLAYYTEGVVHNKGTNDLADRT